MERQDIIKKFLNNGYVLDQNTLNILVEHQDIIDSVLQHLSSNNLQTVTEETIKSFLSKVILIKHFQLKRQKTSPSDLTKILHERYERMRQILSKQLPAENVISINKLSSRNKTFTLIAMVREKEGGRLVVEDSTGEVVVNITNENARYIVEDEVVGLVCEQDQGITVKQIIWPDIQFGRAINKTDGEIICLFAKGTPETDYKKLENSLKDKNAYIFIFRESKTEGENMFFVTSNQDSRTFPDPSIVGIKDIKILLSSQENYSKLWGVKPEVALQQLIKKRHLQPKLDLNAAEDTFFIDSAPDIAVCPSDDASYTNYKGMTIISTSYPHCVAVNLKTRETFKIEIV